MEIKICPRCRKPLEASEYGVSWGVLDPRFKCRKCGYLGLPILLTDEKEEKD